MWRMLLVGAVSVGLVGCNCGGGVAKFDPSCPNPCAEYETCVNGLCVPDDLIAPAGLPDAGAPDVSPDPPTPDAGEDPVPPVVIEISPATLAEGRVGAAYAQVFAATYGMEPFRFAVTSGSLPAGLALAESGELAGIPTSPGLATFEVTATDSSYTPASRTVSYTLAIAEAAPLALEPTIPDGQVGLPYRHVLPASGGLAPYTFRLADGSQLPSGLALSQDGVIEGTPAIAGTVRFSVQVMDAQATPYSLVVPLSLRVLTAAGEIPLEILTRSLPEGAINQPYSAHLEIAGGNPPYLIGLAAGSVLPEGLQLTADGDIAGTPTRAGTLSLVVQVDDSSVPSQMAMAALELVIRPATGEPLAIAPLPLPDAWVGQDYSAQLSASGGTPPYRFGLTPESNLPPGLFIDAAGALRGRPFAAGSYAFTVAAFDSGAPYQMATRALALVVRSDGTNGGLVITSLSLRKAKVGSLYRAQLTAAGGSGQYFWRKVFGTLPPGIALGSTGELRGTTYVQGSFPMLIEVRDAILPETRGYASVALKVMATGSAGLRFHLEPLRDGLVGSYYLQSLRLRAGSAPFTFAMDGASPGLSIAADGAGGGAISGTPEISGRFLLNISVSDSAAAQAWRYDAMGVQPKPGGLMLSTSNLPQGRVNLSYAIQLWASGGRAPYTFALAQATAMPAGLNLSTEGLISGTPLGAGATPIVVEVVDADGASAKVQFWIEIAE